MRGVKGGYCSQFTKKIKGISQFPEKKKAQSRVPKTYKNIATKMTHIFHLRALSLVYILDMQMMYVAVCREGLLRPGYELIMRSLCNCAPCPNVPQPPLPVPIDIDMITMTTATHVFGSPSVNTFGQRPVFAFDPPTLKIHLIFSK